MPGHYRLGVVTVYEFLGERFLVPLRTGFAARLAEKHLRSDKRRGLEDARRYVHRGARQKAVDTYESLIRNDPADARLRLELGDILRRWGRVDEAIAQYSSLAAQYRREGFEARTVALLKQILTLDERRYSAWVSLSEIYEEMGLDGEAMHALQIAIDGLHEEGRSKEALNLLRRICRMDPENTESRLKVAEWLFGQGQTEDAVAEFESVCEEQERVGSEDARIAVYERILEIQPENVEVLLKFSSILVDQGDVVKAKSLTGNAAEAAPDRPEVLEKLIGIYELLGSQQELEETARKLSELHRERGDEEQADAVFQRWVEVGRHAAGEPRDRDGASLLSSEAGACLDSSENAGELLVDVPESDLFVGFDPSETAPLVEPEFPEKAATESTGQPHPKEALKLALTAPGFAPGHRFVPEPSKQSGERSVLEIAELEDSMLPHRPTVPEVDRENSEVLNSVQWIDAIPNPDDEPLIVGVRPSPQDLAPPDEGPGGRVEDAKQDGNDSRVTEDVQTRYDLGVAYREMGLLEEAIEEFARCMDSAECRLDSLHMAALCCFDLEKVTEAAGYLQEALSVPALEQSRREGLLRELARAHEALGAPTETSEVDAFMDFLDLEVSEERNENSKLERTPQAFDDSLATAGEPVLAIPSEDDSPHRAATRSLSGAAFVQTGETSDMDHLAFFGLGDDPFRAVPDSAFYVDTPVLADTQRRLERCLRQGKSLTLLVGGPGTGKSVVARRTLDALGDASFEGVVLATWPAAAGGGGLLQQLARQLGVDSISEDVAVLLGALFEKLLQVRQQGRQPVLVIDDAHWLDSEGLDAVASVLRFEAENRALLPMLLVGPPTLSLRLASHRAFGERTDARVCLNPLDRDETREYLSARIALAGGEASLFSHEVLESLFEHSGGRLRRMQTLADNALFEAYSALRHEVSLADVDRAASDLRPESGSAVGVGGEAPESRADSLEVGLDPVVDAAVGGALAAQCPISILADEDDGLTLELEELPGDEVASDSDVHAGSGMHSEALADRGAEAEGLSGELPALLSEEELAGAEIRSERDERI